MTLISVSWSSSESNQDAEYISVDGFTTDSRAIRFIDRICMVIAPNKKYIIS